jgi:hypothetical protein
MSKFLYHVKKDIAKAVFGFAAFSGLLVGMNGITGAVIGSSSSNTNILGLCLLVCGLLGILFFWGE